MLTDFVGKRVLVLSDHNGLARAIEVNLNRRPAMEVVQLVPSLPGQQRQRKVDDFDLIVVAMSSPASEPIVALSRASLTGQIGKVPLLIISGRFFHSDPEVQIFHLGFPFEVDALCDKVSEILQNDDSRALYCW